VITSTETQHKAVTSKHGKVAPLLGKILDKNSA